MSPTGGRPATSWVHYTTSCNTQSSVPEDGQNNCPNHVELTRIINKPLLLHLVGCLYCLYKRCTVKQISDNEIYLLIKYIKSVLWRIAKRLSYIEEARCLKVKETHLLNWKGPLQRHRRTGSVILKYIFKKWDEVHGLDWSGFVQGHVAGCCECGRKLSGSIKRADFLCLPEDRLASHEGFCTMETATEVLSAECALGLLIVKYGTS
jgi:hypothetical protein